MPSLARHHAFTRPRRGTRSRRGTHARRGTMLVGVLIALSLFMLLVGAVVMAGARDNMQSVDRFAALRAEYNAEAAANMAIREIVLNSDIDANGTIGTFNPANVATLNGGTMTSAATVSGNTTTIDIAGRATGTTGSSATIASNNRLAVRRNIDARPGLYAQLWENTVTYPISNFNFSSTPTRIAWYPNIDYPNTSSGGNRSYVGHSTNIQIRWIGQITLPTGGTWGFGADADDDVQVIVNGVSLFVRGNGGPCAAFNGSLNLAAGTYSYEMRWNDGAGSQCATAYWTPPGGARTIIPPSAFSHVPPNANLVPPLVVSDAITLTGPGDANSKRFDAWNSIEGPYSPALRQPGAARIVTLSTTSGKVNLSNGVVDGNIECGIGGTPTSVITLGTNGTAAGRIASTVRYTVPRVLMPTSMPATSGSLTSSSGTTIVGDVTYDSITLSGTAILRVTANARIRCSGAFSMSGSSSVQIDSAARAWFYVGGAFAVSGTASFNSSQEPNRAFLFMTSGVDDCALTTTNWFAAHIVNPFRAVTINQSAQWPYFYGTLYANSFTISYYARMRLDVGPTSASPGTTSITSWIEP